MQNLDKRTTKNTEQEKFPKLSKLVHDLTTKLKIIENQQK